MTECDERMGHERPEENSRLFASFISVEGMLSRIPMSTLIDRRLGKSTGLTMADLNARLLRVEEDEVLEAKRIPLDTSDKERQGLKQSDRQLARRWEVEELAVAAVVGMLNKEDGSGGLLVLGGRAPDGVIEALEPVSNTKLDKIESALQNKIGASSSPLANFDLTSVRVPDDTEKSIELVEAHPRDRSVLYFSSISGGFYRREGDSTRALASPEYLRLIETKRIAKVYVDVTTYELTPTSTGMDLVVGLRFMNMGNTPGRFICSIIRIDGSIDSAKVSLSGQGTRDESDKNTGPKKVYSAITGYPPSTALVYPRVGVVFGSLRVRDFPDDGVITLSIETYEDKGTTSRHITLRRDGGIIGIQQSEPLVIPY